MALVAKHEQTNGHTEGSGLRLSRDRAGLVAGVLALIGLTLATVSKFIH